MSELAQESSRPSEPEASSKKSGSEEQQQRLTVIDVWRTSFAPLHRPAGTLVFVLSALLLLLIGIPLQRADSIPREFHTYAYYVVAGYAAVLCGVVVTTVLMLYRTVAETIDAVGLAETGHPLLVEDDRRE